MMCYNEDKELENMDKGFLYELERHKISAGTYTKSTYKAVNLFI